MGPAPLASALDVKRSLPTLDQYLTVADQHIADARQRVEEQRQVVQRLEEDGQSSTMARAALVELERAVALLEKDRTLLLHQMGLSA